MELSRTQFGRKSAGIVELKAIDPEFITISVRMPVLWIPALLLSSVSLGLTWMLLHQHTFPRDAAILTGTVSLVFMWHLARAVPRVHLVRFLDRKGEPAIDIVHGDADTAELNDFAEAVAERVRQCSR